MISLISKLSFHYIGSNFVTPNHLVQSLPSEAGNLGDNNQC